MGGDSKSDGYTITNPITGPESLSERQINLLTRYARISKEANWGVTRTCNLLLVLMGERPAARCGGPYCTPTTYKSLDFLQLLDELRMPYIVELADMNLFSERDVTPSGPVRPEYSREYDVMKPAVWFGRDPVTVLGLRRATRTDRSIGEFLGYPEEAIDAFVESDGAPAYDTRNREKELIEEGVLSEEDSKFRELLSYVCPPTIDGFKDAYEHGKQYYAALERFDNYTGTSVATDLAHELMDAEYAYTDEELEKLEEPFPEPLADRGDAVVIYEDGSPTNEYLVVVNRWADVNIDDLRYYVRVKSRGGTSLGEFCVCHSELSEVVDEEGVYNSEVELFRKRRWMHRNSEYLITPRF